MSGHPSAQRQLQPASNLGSQTQVLPPSGTPQDPTPQPAPAILRLTGAHPPSTNHVQWAENVVDNEGLGRKSSKVCCIYHAPKAVGESSDESSSDSSSSDSNSDSDSDPGDRYDAREHAIAQRRARERQRRQDDHRHAPDNAHGHEHNQNHNHNHNHDHSEQPNGRAARDRKRKQPRRPSPNAYEKQPRPKPRDNGSGPSGTGPGSKRPA